MTDPFSRDPFAVDAGPYVLGSLDPAERAQFELHLRACSDCSLAVADLAGLPALLATVPADVAETLADAPEAAAGLSARSPADAVTPPPGLLERVLADAELESARQRRPRRFVVVAAAAAVALVLSLVGVVALTGSQEPTAEDGAQVLVMEAVDDGPLAATASVTSVAWGTRIELECRYSASSSPYATPPVYSLVVTGENGVAEQVATWRAVAGRDITVHAATALATDRIATLEIQTADGRPVLTVDRPPSS